MTANMDRMVLGGRVRGSGVGGDGGQPRTGGRGSAAVANPSLLPVYWVSRLYERAIDKAE